MADEEKDKAEVEELSELDRLENSLKTNRLLFFVSLVFILLVAGFIAVSHFSISNEVGLRREVSSEELSKKFEQMESYFEHLSELQNAQAKLYLDFDETILAVRAAYNDENVNQLRQLMIDREADHQRLLEFMSESVENLSLMTRGDKKWLSDYKMKISEAKKDSEDRAQEIKASLSISSSSAK